MDPFSTPSPSGEAGDGSSSVVAAASAPTGPEGSPVAAGRSSEHPLIWLALLVWLSVEAIGEGLVALTSLLAESTPTATARPTASNAAETTSTTTAEALPTPQVTPS
ncbi:hypothetical protein [Vulcanococcus limneticus]|uniref:hypothetical protein n=1 Tax=Vulcanococcus limneticus TaxID=2170428 RepID=UPI000B987E48|nr:hypothetical protein [Vulcanococcus limneticus]MCP9790922.1 hypothetical protein [Vulcanococcus limneticus MW73D5]MCP9894010.1 hypothetical protein [Vulcanococcus limneticus Candia 3F8]MCP9896032.1 hypothetical protein [Vulcanococcus limneticus Candia 3B3]